MLQREFNSAHEKCLPLSTSEEIHLVINWFPMANLKVFQYFHCVEMASVKLKEDIYANSVKQRSLKKMVCGLGTKSCKDYSTPRKQYTTQCCTKRNEKNSDGDCKEKQTEKTTKISTVPLKRLQESCRNGIENELSAERKTFTDQIQFPESTAVDLQMNVDQTSLCHCFLQHLYERIKSLECGGTGKFI